MLLRKQSLGSVSRDLAVLLAMSSILSPVAAIRVFHGVGKNATKSMNATERILDVVTPLKPFMDAVWPQDGQDSTFIHPPITDIQANTGKVCPYARAQGNSTTPTAQDASNPIIKPRAGAIRVMVVGDSISQGLEGDYTWRYRIWQWFQGQGVDVDFVGPWIGTKPMTAPGPPVPPTLQDAPVVNTAPSQVTSGGYAAGASTFDSAHYSAWGRQLAQASFLIANQVATYQPDYLLVLLGFNDVGWFISDAEGTFESMEDFINEARSANPNIKMALANIPQRSYIGGRNDLPVKTDVYNQILKSAIPWLNTSQSHLELVELRENYDCDVGGCPAGYDGLHPNALGEFQIAQAFSKTLVNGFGVGTSILQIPAAGAIPIRPNALPTNFKAVSSPQGITVTWDNVYGARNYDIQMSLNGQPWTTWSVSTTRYDTSWVLDGWSYEFMVRTNNGVDAYDTITTWSAGITAICHPLTPAAPSGIITEPTATGFKVFWNSEGSGITEWSILYLDTTIAGSWLAGIGIEAPRLSASVDGLVPGHNYIVAIQGWNQYGGGFPGVGNNIVVGGTTVPVPTNLQITSLDPTTIELDWCGSPLSAAYELWWRNINTAGSVYAPNNSTIAATTADWAYLFPGVWNYEFCVSAVNGDLNSVLSNCVVAPQPGSVSGGPVGGANCYSPTANGGPGWGDPTPACTSGTGPGNYADLCVFTCSLGFCPQPCTCLAEGPQNRLPGSDGNTGYPIAGEDDSYAALCSFACSLGYCPTSACSASSGSSGSGSATGVIYLPPGVTNIGCAGYCTFILPPSPLPTPETISWPPLTTTLLSSASGTIYTITTVITIPVFTITQINYWSVTVQASDPTTAIFVPEQSVMPPAYVLNLPGNEATFPPSAPSSYSNFKPVSTSSSTSAAAVFFPGSYQVTIQPQPTILISTPSPTLRYTYSSTSDVSSQPTCTSGCGHHDCSIFGCGSGGCGLFGCGGGCGLFGCGGGCGILGCGGCSPLLGCGSTTCPLIVPGCSNPGCALGACPGPAPGIGSGGGGSNNNPTTTPKSSTMKTTTCSKSTTVTMCEAFCSVTNFVSTTYTACVSTTCTKTVTGCSVTGTTTTSRTTTTITCPVDLPYVPWYTNSNQLLPTLGVNDSGGWLVSSGTWTPQFFTPSTTSQSSTSSAKMTTKTTTSKASTVSTTSKATTSATKSTTSKTSKVSTKSTTTTSAVPTQKSFDFYKWESINSDGSITELYTAGIHGVIACLSTTSMVSLTGTSVNVCGDEVTIGAGFPAATYVSVVTGNQQGNCSIYDFPSEISCGLNNVDYSVYLTYSCNLAIC